MLESDANLVIGSTILDGYTITRHLGSGGMGHVFLVERNLSNRKLQFALKVLKPSITQNQEQRESFFRELKTWISLPQNPYLTACYFFRTIGNQIGIFAEYIDGGTLKQRIQNDSNWNLKIILDIFIQAAWGLHTAHVHKVIHQDIKPANILLTSQGIAKITDFGLAHETQVIQDEQDPESTEDTFFSETGGMTIPFCSPEQARGIALTRRTDIWSFGLTLLTTFIGKVTWRVGTAAMQVLQRVEDLSDDGNCVPLPQSIIEILTRCFQDEPHKRWKTSLDLANALIHVYEDQFQKTYPRQQPDIQDADGMDFKIDRRTDFNTVWLSPGEIQDSLLSSSEGSIPEISFPLENTKTLRNQAISDLEQYLTMEKHVLNLLNKERIPIHACTLFFSNKALIHYAVDDLPGMNKAFETAVNLLLKQRTNISASEYHHFLFKINLNIGQAYQQKRNFIQAASYFDQAELSMKKMENIPGSGLDNRINNLYLTNCRAVLACKSDNLEEAEILLRTVLEISVPIMKTRAQVLPNQLLASIYANLATIRWKKGHPEDAITHFNHAIELQEELYYRRGFQSTGNSLARSYMNTAGALGTTGQLEAAIPFHTKAVELLEELVYKNGITNLRSTLAGSYCNHAATLGRLGRDQEALLLFDRVISMLEYLIYTEGQEDLLFRLAMVLDNKATAHETLVQTTEALAAMNSAEQIYQSIQNQKGVRDFNHIIAEIKLRKASIFLDIGNKQDAFEESSNALNLLKSDAKTPEDNVLKKIDALKHIQQRARDRLGQDTLSLE